MIFETIFSNLVNLLRPELLGMLFIGTAAGLIFGALPGLSGITGLALALPFTFGMDPLGAMLIFSGLISVTPLGGSIPAILLNTPGTAPSAATCFDGFPLTQKGEGSRAIAISSTCCFVGTIFGIIVFYILLYLIIPILLHFRAPEMFWLVVFGIMVISLVVKEAVLKGLAAGGFGILLSMIGFSGVFPSPRFTAGSNYLWDGIALVPLYIGLFALGELIVYTVRGGTIAPKGTSQKTNWEQMHQGVVDVIKRPLLVIRSSIIGTLVGLTPGVGGAVSAFISYSVAKQTSKHPETFGKGNIEGVIAAETANDAKEGGSLLPTVAFGIPGSAAMAIVLGAFVIHGFEPGPSMLRDHFDVVSMLALGICLSQLVASTLVFFIAPWLARMVTIKTDYLAPVIIILCFAGAYSIRENVWDLFLCVGAGYLGYLFKRYGYPIIPVAIGYILGGLAETAFHQSIMMSYGDYKIFFSSSICIVLMILVILLPSYPYIKNMRRKRFSNMKGIIR